MKTKLMLPLISAWMIGLTSCLVQDEDYETNSEIIELKGEIREDLHLKSGTEYLLTGQTSVKSGVTLTIDPGVTIKGLPYDNVGQASVLVIERGGYIIAEGTKEEPITFTSALEESALPQKGLWGGLIILGDAPINKSGGEAFIEGLAGVPYGGDDISDSSGVLKYVRVWYGGRSIGEGNEINGVTFGGVGNRTVVENVEVAWNNDDGFEWFGGTVNAKNLSVLFVGDDAFDMDQGYQGNLQYLFAIMGRNDVGRGFEIDNSGSDMDVQPRTSPQISNVTLVGPAGGTPGGDGTDQLMRLREGTGGDFRNIVALGANGVGLRVSDDPTLAILTQEIPDSKNELYFSPNNIVTLSLDSNYHEDLPEDFTFEETDPQLVQVTVDKDYSKMTGFDPRPSDENSIVFTSFDNVVDNEFFETVNYSGAFKQDLWIDGWSWMSEQNLLP